MKIVQLVTQMEAGGAQRVAWLLTEGLRERGHDAQLWFLYKKRPAYEENGHVRVLFSERPRLHDFSKLGIRLWEELRTQRPDAVITHTHSANAFAAPIAAAARVPVRLAVHHNPIETYSLAMRVLDRCAFAAGCYSSMVTVSEGVTESFYRYSDSYQRRLHRIYNAIAPADAKEDADIRVKYGIPAQMRILVNVGRLATQKNQGLLLQMLQRIPAAFLLLVGEGELRRELFAEAVVLGVAERVRFTGELKAGQVTTILRQADLFLLPSLFESFCLAGVEAMLCGLPVIASDLPCLREVLGDQQLFFPLNNVAELSNKVRYVLEDREQRMQMRTAGQLQAEQFTISRMVRDYEELLADAFRYAGRKSTANDLPRFDALGGVSRVHYHP